MRCQRSTEKYRYWIIACDSFKSIGTPKVAYITEKHIQCSMKERPVYMRLCKFFKWRQAWREASATWGWNYATSFARLHSYRFHFNTNNKSCYNEIKFVFLSIWLVLKTWRFTNAVGAIKFTVCCRMNWSNFETLLLVEHNLNLRWITVELADSKSINQLRKNSFVLKTTITEKLLRVTHCHNSSSYP